MMQTIESLQAETAALNEASERLQPILEDLRARNAEYELEVKHLMFQMWFLKEFKEEPRRDVKGLYQPFWNQSRFVAFCAALDMAAEYGFTPIR